MTEQLESQPCTHTDSRTRAPKISVVLPSYNTAKYIPDALQSVFSQTYPNYEVIVVNDGSPDTPELERALQPFAQRIHYIKTANAGVSSARNTGIQAATGEIIAFLDSDDMWEPNYLEVQLAALHGPPKLDLVYPNAVYFGGPDEGRLFMDLCPSEGDVTFEALVQQRCTVMTSVSARRSALIEAGMYNPAIRKSEDFDLWLRIVRAGFRIGYHRHAIVRYRQRQGSLSSDSADMAMHAKLVLERLMASGELTASERLVVSEAILGFETTSILLQAKAAFAAGDFETASARLARANTLKPNLRWAVAATLLRVCPTFLQSVYHTRSRLAETLRGRRRA